jgi:hypothetical protein
MNNKFQNYAVKVALNFSAVLLIGALAFCIFSILDRENETWVRRIGGAFYLFPLSAVFAVLIFWVPGLLYSVLSSALMSVSCRWSAFVSLFTAGFLGFTLFPFWLLILDDPLASEWKLISCIGGVSSIFATIITKITIEKANNSRHRTSRCG